MRVLVTGSNGQLGFDVVKLLNKKHIECRGVDQQHFDITDPHAVKLYLAAYRPDVIVHCAAYTAVDKAEEEREIAYKVNAEGTRYLAGQARNLDAKFIYISTDYVFDGKGTEPFAEDHACEPVNYYGQTKYQGECAVREMLEKYFIIRISWVFGTNGNNFVRKMLELSQTRSELTVVNDQIGSPTYTPDLAGLIYKVIQSDAFGVYHATNTGYCSWYDFAKEIFRLAGRDTVVKPVSSADYKTAAARPFNSRLSQEKLDENGFGRLPSWQDALQRYLKSELI